MLRKIALTVICAVFTCSSSIASEDLDIAFNKLLKDAEKNRRDIVAQNMILPKDQQQAFWGVYDTYRTEMAKIERRKYKLLQDYLESDEKLDNKQADRVLDKYLSILTDHLDQRKNFVPKFEKIISNKKVLRFVQIERRLDIMTDAELGQLIELVE